MARPSTLAEPLRRRLAGEVQRLFNDHAAGERPVEISDHALISRNSVAWRVHGDVTTMMIGGVAALLLQMLHPAALAGVWDHSNFRQDMLGRLRRTARFIAVTTYGERDQAEAAIARVRAIHNQVGGILPGGKAYSADDPRLLAWVHVAGSLMFLEAWVRFAEPAMSGADQDRYFADVAPIAEMLGAAPVPRTRVQADAFMTNIYPELLADARARAVRDVILDQRASLPLRPVERLISQSAIDILPDFARRMHALRRSGIGRPAITASAMGLASTLRWALRRR